MDENEIRLEFIRASGPGGQNVNKVSSAVQLRFDILGSSSLNQETKDRLIKICGSRITDQGVLIIVAKRYRTQEHNRADAVNRLSNLIQKAFEKIRVRKPTRPSIAASVARVDRKKKHGNIKMLRQHPTKGWE